MAAVVRAALGFGLSPPLTQVANAGGGDPLTINLLRFLLTAGALAWLARRAPAGSAITPGHRLIAALPLGVAFALAGSGYLVAIRSIPVSVATVIFYAFPIVTLLIGAALGWERLGRARLAAAIACFAGIALAIGFAPGALDPLGLAAAVAAAAGSVGVSLLGARPSPPGDRDRMRADAALVAAFLMVPAVAATGGPGIPSGGTALVAFLGVGAIYALATVLWLVAMAKLGAGRAALGMNIEPVATLLAARLVLDERLAPAQALGAITVLAALVALSWHERRGRR
jgi:drug/metabolite transporter (DMT)-like permease